MKIFGHTGRRARRRIQAFDRHFGCVALIFAAVFGTLAAPGRALAIDQTEVDAIIARIDARQTNTGDYKSLAYIEQKSKGKNDLVYQSVVYRRDEDDKLMILFLKPKSEAGKGYLRLDKNLFLFDPSVGKWERRTERERILGTDFRRSDFDESRLTEEYDARFVATEKLGRFTVHRLQLTAKKGVEVAYPIQTLWVDAESGNILKSQQRALSGRLMRTSYFPKWEKRYSESKKADVYFPREMRIFDEVEKGNRTTVVLRKVDLRPLSANIFTKAWLESKSR